MLVTGSGSSINKHAYTSVESPTIGEDAPRPTNPIAVAMLLVGIIVPMPSPSSCLANIKRSTWGYCNVVANRCGCCTDACRPMMCSLPDAFDATVKEKAQQ